MNKAIFLVMLTALISCKSTTESKTSYTPDFSLFLSNEMIAKANSDFDTLYDVWLKKLFYQSKNQLYKRGHESVWGANDLHFREGFTKFCEKAGYEIWANNHEIGFTDYYCSNKQGETQAKISITPGSYYYFSNTYFVNRGISEKLRKIRVSKFSLSKNLNGPTGWLHWSNGKKLRFIRIGHFNSQFNSFVGLHDEDGHIIKQYFLSDVMKMDHTSYSDYDYTLTDGTVLSKDVDPQYYSVGIKAEKGRNILELFVVLHPLTQEPYTLIASSPYRIVIDEYSTWKTKPLNKITSKLDSTIVNIVAKETRAKIDLLLKASHDEGWDVLIPTNGVKISQHVSNQISNKFLYPCSGVRLSISKGIGNVDRYGKCLLAKRDSKLFHKGYEISYEATPLTYLFMLEAIRSDYKG
jgi:hypothetical protein